MPTPRKTFSSDAEEVAAAFLQTAVVVDDESFKPETAGRRAEAQVQAEAVTKRPGRRRSASAEPAEPAGEVEGLSEHDLDPKAIIDAFARTGLVCAVLSPSLDEDPSATLLPAARRADLVVLDWVMHEDDGDRTKKLIAEILQSDEEAVRRRLRTIAIYTAQDDLRGVAGGVKEILETQYLDCELVEIDGGLTFERGAVRMTVLAKPDIALTDDLLDRQVDVSELPKRLISEFSALAAGLVSGVALASLAALRDDAHRVLQALPAELDASFLGHRSALAVPEDAKEGLVDLIASELMAVLHDHDVGVHADHAHIRRWLDERAADTPGLGQVEKGEGAVAFDQERLRLVVKNGLGSKEGRAEVSKGWSGTKDSHLTHVQRHATELFANTTEEAVASDALLMERMMVRTRYARPKRRLTLGTLVRDVEGTYLLCVQPRCDSVRIGNRRAFPFLVAEAPKPRKGPDLVVAEPDGKLVRLRVPRDPYTMRLIVCKGSGGVCLAEAVDDALHFATENTPLTWIADLEDEYGQRFAGQLAANLSRVGLDEHEIMRLNREA